MNSVPRGSDPAVDANPASTARSIVLRQLSHSAKSRFQLSQKLAEREIPADVAEAVLDRFEVVKLIDDAEFAQIGQAVEAIAERVKDRPEQLAAEKKFSGEMNTKVEQLSKDLVELKTTLGNTQDHSQTQRPPVTGGGKQALAEF